jgi:dipeptidyl-peptidase-3
MGNYSSHDGCKFIPELDCDKLEEILKCSDKIDEIRYIWDCIKGVVYDNSSHYKTIKLKENNGINSYYLGDIKEEDIKTIDSFLIQNGVDVLNTRLMMVNQNKLAYLVASIDNSTQELNDQGLIGHYGEFSSFLGRVSENFLKAREYSHNDVSSKMIDEYLEWFKSGKISNYKESQRYWLEDEKPHVEANISWCNSFLDPVGVRGQYQGFVAVTDRDKTRKFCQLADNAEIVFNNLPWNYDFEKMPLTNLCFSALSLISFCSTNCPIGLNIHSQDHTKIKNLSFLNVLPSFDEKSVNCIPDKDKELISLYGESSYIMFIGCKELISNSSGILFKKSKDGKYTFGYHEILNPITGEVIDKW